MNDGRAAKARRRPRGSCRVGAAVAGLTFAVAGSAGAGQTGAPKTLVHTKAVVAFGQSRDRIAWLERDGTGFLRDLRTGAGLPPEPLTEERTLRLTPPSMW